MILKEAIDLIKRVEVDYRQGEYVIEIMDVDRIFGGRKPQQKRTQKEFLEGVLMLKGCEKDETDSFADIDYNLVKPRLFATYTTNSDFDYYVRPAELKVISFVSDKEEICVGISVHGGGSDADDFEDWYSFSIEEEERTPITEEGLFQIAAETAHGISLEAVGRIEFLDDSKLEVDLVSMSLYENKEEVLGSMANKVRQIVGMSDDSGDIIRTLMGD